MEEFEQRATSAPAQSPSKGEGVAHILAAYGVEPAKEGARPEIEDEDEPTGSRGSSGQGGSPRSGKRAAWDAATLSQVAGTLTTGALNRQALVEKYPAIRDGGQ